MSKLHVSSFCCQEELSDTNLILGAYQDIQTHAEQEEDGAAYSEEEICHWSGKAWLLRRSGL